MEKPSVFDEALAGFMSVIVETLLDLQPSTDPSVRSPLLVKTLQLRLRAYLADPGIPPEVQRLVLESFAGLMNALEELAAKRQSYS